MGVSVASQGRRRAGVPVEFAQAPMRTVRVADAGGVYAHPAAQLARLERLGLLHKVAVGYYVVVPQDRVGLGWKPSIEAAAAGVAAAAVGAGRAVLTGVTAARMHQAIPRALGVAIVAAPKRRHDIAMRDRDATIHFVVRDTDGLDAELMATELGQCLVTTPEQTALDLAHHPDLGDAADEAHGAIAALLPRCDPQTLERIAAEQRLGAALRRLRRVAA
jgi:predicted transcriptional regulator of viral defense system